jgi:Domain of unknown function (DUF5753)
MDWSLSKMIRIEAALLIIRNFEALMVPGLLQTEDYALVVIRQFEERDHRRACEHPGEFRMRRQQQLR